MKLKLEIESWYIETWYIETWYEKVKVIGHVSRTNSEKNIFSQLVERTTFFQAKFVNQSIEMEGECTESLNASYFPFPAP